MPSGAFYHVFLSHHTEDQPAVEAIARQLRVADLTPFLDRWHLIPGDPWMEAIEEALASSETVAVFVGPSGIGPWQNEEMRVALYDSALRGKRVIPVLLPGADPQRISPFLTRRTWVDFCAGPDDAGALQRLIAGIQGQASEAGGYLSPLDLAPPKHYFTPFQAPPLPPYFVPRPAAAEAIRTALLDARLDTPGVLAISAIHGLGGIGKTTLIASLAHDPAIRQRYPDGILWATLGQQPELFPRLFEWIQHLGDYTFKPTTLEVASSHLRALLIDKACLLVVDDAWQREHVDHFLVGGARSQVVITTRDATLARKLRAHLHDLDVMTEAQALALFEGRLGALPAENERDQAAALARELGYLPLAFELAAAQIESGRSWGELLGHFRSAFVDLAILDLDEPTRRDESLRICFALSLDSLAEDDRNAFFWLGVLPEGAVIGPALAATLWNETATQARERLRRLGHKALLKPVGEEGYTLHDLLYEEARSRLAQQMPIPNAHGTLLARYQARTVDGSWHTLDNDGYIHAHLIWHMAQAERWVELHTLVAEGTGALTWAAARHRLEGSYAGYLADVRLAWKRADEERLRDPVAVGRQVRYALIESCMHSFSANIPPNMLAALMEEKVEGWTPEAAVGYALQIPDERQRTAAVCQLVKLVSPGLRVGLLSAVRRLNNAVYRLRALKVLAEHLSPELRDQALLDAWYAASEIDGRTLEDLDEFRLHAHSIGLSDTIRLLELIELLPQMPPDFRDQAFKGLLANAKRILDDEYRAGVLQNLAEMQPSQQREEMLKDAWAAAQSIDRKERQAAVLSELAAHIAGDLREQVLQEALTAFRSVEDNQAQLKLLEGLLPQLAPEQQEQVLQEMLTLVKSRSNDFHALIGLLPHLSPDLRKQTGSEILSELQSMDEWNRRYYLPLLAQQQVAELADDILSTAESIAEEEQRAYTLAELAPRLSSVELSRSLEAAVQIEDGDYCMVALRGLAPYLTHKEQERVLDKLRSIGSDFACPDWRVMLMLELYPIFPDELYSDLTTAIDTLSDNVQRAEFVTKFAGMLTGGRRRQAHGKALSAIKRIRDRSKREFALALLTPQLSRVLLAEAVEVVGRIEDDNLRVSTYAQFSSCLPHRLQSQALAAIDEIEDETVKAIALVKLSETLPANLFPHTVRVMRNIQDKMLRTYTVIGVMPYVPSEFRALVTSIKPDTVTPLGEAAAALGCWEDEYAHRIVRLPPLAGQSTLPPDKQRSTLQWFIQEKQDIYEAKEALFRVLPHVSSELAPEFLNAINERLKGEERTKALVHLARHLSPELIAGALAATREFRRTEFISGVAGFIQDHVAMLELREGREPGSNLRLPFEITRSQALTKLAPYLTSRNLQSEALAIAGEIKGGFFRAEALVGLAPHLPAEFLQQIIAYANSIEKTGLRTWALSGAAQHLPIDDFRQLVGNCRDLSEKSLRRRVWAGLADRWALWAKQMPQGANRLWTETLHVLATRPRPEILSDLESLAPVIVALGGNEVGAETVRAVMDVGRWWP